MLPVPGMLRVRRASERAPRHRVGGSRGRRRARRRPGEGHRRVVSCSCAWGGWGGGRGGGGGGGPPRRPPANQNPEWADEKRVVTCPFRRTSDQHLRPPPDDLTTFVLRAFLACLAQSHSSASDVRGVDESSRAGRIGPGRPLIEVVKEGIEPLALLPPLPFPASLPSPSLPANLSSPLLSPQNQKLLLHTFTLQAWPRSRSPKSSGVRHWRSGAQSLQRMPATKKNGAPTSRSF